MEGMRSKDGSVAGERRSASECAFREESTELEVLSRSTRDWEREWVRSVVSRGGGVWEARRRVPSFVSRLRRGEKELVFFRVDRENEHTLYVL